MTRFAFVSAERGSHAVTTLCRVVGASVSGFYAWLRAIPAVQNRAGAEAELRGHLGRIFAARRRVYGSPRVHTELHRAGRRHGRRRIEESFFASLKKEHIHQARFHTREAAGVRLYRDLLQSAVPALSAGLPHPGRSTCQHGRGPYAPGCMTF